MDPLIGPIQSSLVLEAMKHAKAAMDACLSHRQDVI
jgi:hypothetical protein